jgi:uncharacterized membrane protein YdjX (TVP38/TMEM64 family)
MITEKHRKILSAVAIVAFILFCAVIGWFIGRPMVRFVSAPESFRAWVDSSGIMGRIYFILMVLFQVVIAFVPGEPLEIGAGYAFGAVEGTVLCLIGIALGSFIVFALVRKFGIHLVEVFFTFEKIKSAKFLQDRKKVAFLTFLMFFLSGTPKDLLTYFVPLTRMKLSEFLFITLIARIPSVVSSTIGGNLFSNGRYIEGVLILLLTGAISVLGIILYRIILKKYQNRKRNT